MPFPNSFRFYVFFGVTTAVRKTKFEIYTLRHNELLIKK